MKPKDWTHLHPKYAGQWVALAEDWETVVAAAKTLKTAIDRARKRGVDLPSMFRVPEEMTLYVGSFQG